LPGQTSVRGLGFTVVWGTSPWLALTSYSPRQNEFQG
jgi:hypothetical protein